MTMYLLISRSIHLKVLLCLILKFIDQNFIIIKDIHQQNNAAFPQEKIHDHCVLRFRAVLKVRLLAQFNLPLGFLLKETFVKFWQSQTQGLENIYHFYMNVTRPHLSCNMYYCSSSQPVMKCHSPKKKDTVWIFAISHCLTVIFDSQDKRKIKDKTLLKKSKLQGLGTI